jgi:MYXO-CTERM domain-containing protein
VIGTVTGTARVPGGAPCGGTNFTTVLRHIKLVETAEKIDITPCTDAQGAFAPGPDCKDFLTDIRTGGGAWPMCNYGPKTTAPIDSCGDGPGGEGGADGGGGTGGADAAAAKDGPRAADGAADSGGARDVAGTGGAGGAVAMDAAGAAGGAGGGAGGAGGSGEKGSDAAPAVPPTPPVHPTPGTTTGGCGCQVGATDVAGTRVAPLALIALWLLERRRRRRALAGRA